MTQNPLSAQAKRWIQKPIKDDLHLWMLRHPQVGVEDKIDGMRVLTWSDDKGHVAIVTPHNGVYTKSDFPALFDNFSISDNSILDGELVRKSEDLYLFDALWVNGVDVRSLSFSLRKIKIFEALPKMGLKVRVLPSLVTESEEAVRNFYEKALQQGFEGIVAKDIHASYGATNSWLKMKHFDTIDVVVISTYITEKQNTGYSIAVYDEKGSIHPLGDVYSAVEEVDRDKIFVGTVLELSYQPTIGFKALRHPVIERIREDKPAEECLLSQFKN